MFFKRENINAGVEECRNTAGSALLDVREEDEFQNGHIPGALNVPLSRLGEVLPDKNASIFVYCLWGTRSRRAAQILKSMGYTSVRSIGGIVSYKGDLER